MAHNIMVKATPLTNVRGRVKYITSEEKQENLVAVYSSVSDPTFWKELSQHCQEQAKYSKSKNACEGREFMFAFANDIADLKNGEQLAAEVSSVFKELTGTENVVGLHWNQKKNNFHVHVVVAENPEINIVKKGAVLTRNTYYNAEGQRANKKECVNDSGELLPGCRFIPKGGCKDEIIRFGPKIEFLSNKNFLEIVKQRVVDFQNDLLQEERFIVYQDDGLHLRQQHVGKHLPAEIKLAVEEKNAAIKSYNLALDTYLAILPKNGGKGEFEAQKGAKKLRQEIREKAMTAEWLPAVREATNWLRETVAKQMDKEKFADNNQGDEKIKYSPEDILKALREVCRQSDALYDKRRPADPEIQEAPGRLRRALAELELAFARYQSARNGVAVNKWPWQKEQRAEARKAADVAYRQLDHIFRMIIDSGVTAYHDGIQMTAENLDYEDIQYICRCGTIKADDLQRKADYELRHARPSDALVGSATNFRSAEAHLENLLQKVPAGNKTVLLEAMIGFVDRYPVSNGSVDARLARNQLIGNLKSKLHEADTFAVISSVVEMNADREHAKTQAVLDQLMKEKHAKNQAAYKRLLKEMER